MSINLTTSELNETLPRIVVFGVGGAGGNAVNNMIESELQGVEFVAANTDAQALSKSRATRQIRLGAGLTEGLGAGAKPEVGRQAAEEALPVLMEHLEGTHMCFITAGMGGGTGTGAAPVIARAAREAGVLTVGVVTKPFQFEGKRRMAIADEGVRELQQNVDTLIVIPNQNLFRVANEKTTFADAFKIADEVLHSGVRSITDLMVEPGLINLDFADVRTVMNEMGKAMMGTGEAEGEDRAKVAAGEAIANPLLEDLSLASARGVLINVTGGMDLTLHEVDEAASLIREEVDEDAHIIIGSILDPALDGKMRVSVVATGIESAEMQQSRPAAGFTPRVVGTEAGEQPVATAAPAAAAPAMPHPVPPRMPSFGATAGATAMKMDPVEDVAPEIEEPRQMTIDDIAEPTPVEAVAEAQPAPEPYVDAEDASLRPDYQIPTFPTNRGGPPPAAPRVAGKVMEPGRVSESQGEVVQPEEPKKRSLFQRLTQRASKPETVERQEPRRSLFGHRDEQPAEPGRSEPRMSAPRLDLGDPQAPAGAVSEDELDIPAFLRRQAN